jgi:hypothetical protein
VKSGWALTGLCLTFVVAFFVQRNCSVVLQIEDDRPLAERIALETGISIPEVMSLRDLQGLDRSEAQLEADAELLSRLRTERGDDLAILTITGHEELAQELWKQSNGDPSRASILLRDRPEAILATRFKSMRERFAARQAR